MNLRYALSQLSRPAARRAFGRTWFWICAAGALLSATVFGWRHIFFIATIWVVCVFAPVRIAVEILHSCGPRIRRDLQRGLRRRDDRYATPAHAVLMVETLFASEVQLPRLAPPDLPEKVIEAAARLSHDALRTSAGPAAVHRAAITCAALLQWWTRAIAAGETAEPAAAGNGGVPPALWNPAASVQDQWVPLRAVAGLAALTKTLTAVYEDLAGATSESGAALRALCEAAMDYVDQVGLCLDGPGWEDTGGVPPEALTGERLRQLADTWMTFCAAPLPAPRRLRAFVESLAG